MKLPFLAVGLRSRLCHLSIAAIAALATVLGWMIERQIGARIRASSTALLDRAQPVVAARAAALLDRSDEAALARMLEEVAATDPFVLAACCRCSSQPVRRQ